MSEKRNQSASKRIRTICFAAMFAALICACTFMSVPLPIGYFNLGDVAVLLASYVLGFPAVIAAALGSALADLFMGYAVYAPATAIIKGTIALIVCLAMRLAKKYNGKTPMLLVQGVASVIGEAFMVAGYLFFEAIALSYGAGALASVPGNCLQGACGVIGAMIIYTALKLSGALRFVERKNKE